MADLWVGVGESHQSLGSAIAASTAGDTMYIRAGEYQNNFATINHDLRIVGVDGLAHLSATASIPNRKAILVVRADVELVNMEFSGDRDSIGNGPDGGRDVLRLAGAGERFDLRPGSSTTEAIEAVDFGGSGSNELALGGETVESATGGTSPLTADLDSSVEGGLIPLKRATPSFGRRTAPRCTSRTPCSRAPWPEAVRDIRHCLCRCGTPPGHGPRRSTRSRSRSRSRPARIAGRAAR